MGFYCISGFSLRVCGVHPLIICVCVAGSLLSVVELRFSCCNFRVCGCVFVAGMNNDTKLIWCWLIANAVLGAE